jgi:glycogen debranching enzyme
MDASIDGCPVTPRAGKAVEIQALWYNALRIMETLAARFDMLDDAVRYDYIAETARRSFNEKFWYPERSYLFDNIENAVGDPSLRPNQILAASVNFTMLDDARRRKVVQIVWEKLWATYGLRTLSNDDSRYIGRYTGSFVERDQAYHNGTVWAWLLGPFVTAFLETKKYAEKWRQFAFDKFLRPLFNQMLYQAGVGTISEVFDGDAPHSPGGCISQAWSVAEPLRAYVEEVLLDRPPYERFLNPNSCSEDT